jgi:hypothetical protein
MLWADQKAADSLDITHIMKRKRSEEMIGQPEVEVFLSSLRRRVIFVVLSVRLQSRGIQG